MRSQAALRADAVMENLLDVVVSSIRDGCWRGRWSAPFATWPIRSHPYRLGPPRPVASGRAIEGGAQPADQLGIDLGRRRQTHRIGTHAARRQDLQARIGRQVLGI